MLFQNIEFHNVREILALNSGSGFRLNRLPDALCERINDGAQSAAYNTCGCEIRFQLKGPSAQVTLQRAPVPPLAGVNPRGVAEVYYGSFQGPWQESPFIIGPEPTVITVQLPGEIETLEAITRERSLPYDPRLVRILLPYDWPTWFVDVEGEVARPEPGQTPLRRLLMYGSSITHGGTAVRPGETYAMLSAENLGMDLINLGFAGSAQIEPEIAEFIVGGLDWDVAVLEMGINVLNWPVEQFKERVEHFVETIAAAGRPVFCVDLFTYAGDVKGTGQPEAFRNVVREAAARLKNSHVHYLDGRALLPNPARLTTDLVHPSARGMQTIARRLAKAIRAKT